MKIIQMLPVVAYGDAIGNHTLALYYLIKNMGYETGIYADVVDGRLPKGVAHETKDLPLIGYSDIVLYHLSTGSSLNLKINDFHCKKIIEYHNITPPNFFYAYNSDAENNCKNGLLEARKLANVADYCIADSTFNKCDLIAMGYRQNIDVAPILIPFEDYDKEPSQKVIDQYNDGKTNVIFTGRIAPNKKQEDVIKAFYYYQKYFNSNSRLIIVGNYGGMETYYHQLREYAEALELENVIFTGHIPFNKILGFYHIADLFVCMSEHEGFCVPLVEAMYFEIPIVAYDCCAIGETLGEGGILLDDKDPRIVAEAMNKLLTDKLLKDTILQKQKKSLQRFQYDIVAKQYREIFESLIK